MHLGVDSKTEVVITFDMVGIFTLSKNWVKQHTNSYRKKYAFLINSDGIITFSTPVVSSLAKAARSKSSSESSQASSVWFSNSSKVNLWVFLAET